MAQIKKKFIADNAVDGSKILLENNESIRVKSSAGSDVELFKLDSSNILQFLTLPRLASDPSDGGDMVRKSYLDSELATEVAARIAGDLAEQSAREAAMAAEQAAREAADETLQDNIDAEALARQTADDNLQDQIDALDSGSSAGLAQEIADRQAGDANLQSQVDAEKARIDAILLASDADKDSFAEIVNLINSVDTTNDNAFAAYVLSNDAALAQEVSDRQAAVSAEAAARAAADSAEASARQAADATLQSNLDAKTLDALANVVTADKADGHVMEWDSSTSKWVNVAPLTAASAAASGGPETVVSSYTSATASSTSEIPFPETAVGTTYKPSSNMTVSKVGLKIGRTSDFPSDRTVTARIYAVSESVANSQNNVTFNSADLTLVASSTNSLGSSDLTLYPSLPSMEYFTFDNVALTANQYYIIWAEISGVALGTDTPAYMAPAYTFGSGNQFPNAHFKQLGSGGKLQGLPDLILGYEVYTGGGSVAASVGLIKTNEDGFLDESFLEYDVNFGGHKLQGVAAPTANTDAANKKYVDDEVSAEETARIAGDAAEASARTSAIAAEQSAREAADDDLQDQIDALDNGSSAALAQEISDRQAGDSNLQSQLDTEKGRIDAILLASDADKDSFAEIVALINSVDTENDSAFASYVLSNDAALAQEVSNRQAADSAEQSAREAADETLQDNIDAEEAARIAAVSAEQSAREAADAAEEAARIANAHHFVKVRYTLTSTDITNGYVDLDHVAKNESVHVFLDRLACHESDDYTLSVVDGVTRVTFTNSFKTSEEGPGEGDLFRCGYAYSNGDQV